MIIAVPDVLKHAISGNHIVKVYSDDADRINSVSHYISEGLMKGEAVVIIARSLLRKALINFLVTQGFDVQSCKDQYKIQFFDAEMLLSNLQIDGGIDAEAFEKNVSAPIIFMNQKYGKIRFFGEMVDLLWQKGAYDESMQLEDKVNDLLNKIEFSRLCTYSLNHLDASAYDESLEKICKCHTHHIPPEISELSTSLDSFDLAWKRAIKKFKSQHYPKFVIGLPKKH